MRIHDVLGSPPAILLGLGIARLLPPRLGYWLAGRIARSLARRRVELWRTVRANLAHVVAPGTSEEQLSHIAEQAIRHAGCCYFDMLHYTIDDYLSGRAAIDVDPAEWEPARRALLDGERGTVLVGPHVSNFDLATQWIAAQGVAMQGLGLPNPNRGTQMVNALRKRHGVRITPLSVEALREAIERLKAGEVVLTGVDRPASSDDDLLPFFGQPAPMPDGHVRLALQTGSRIQIACCVRQPNGRYRVHLAPPLEIEPRGGREETIRHNMLRVLAILEEMIRRAPEQWLMFVPVWPADASTAQESATEGGEA